MKPKTIILFFFLSLLNFFAIAQSGYVVRVKLSSKPLPNAVVLSYFNQSKLIRDSTPAIQKGFLIFKGKVKEPVLAMVWVNRQALKKDTNTLKKAYPFPPLNFFLSNEPIVIKGDEDKIDEAEVKGGKYNEQWGKTRDSLAQLAHKKVAIMRKGLAKYFLTRSYSDFKNEIKDISVIQQKYNAIKWHFIKTHPSSLVSIYLLSTLMNDLVIDPLENNFNKLAVTYKNSIYGQAIKSKIDSLKITRIGQVAVLMNKHDMNGRPVNLINFKGKYVLIDFWGSWCHSCRESHPYLKSLYNTYKNNGFEIIGIAQEFADNFASAKAKWQNAIKEDDINWVQVLNQENISVFDAVKSYNIKIFPTKILLDKEGRILARFVGDDHEQLDLKLKQIFGE